MELKLGFFSNCKYLEIKMMDYDMLKNYSAWTSVQHVCFCTSGVLSVRGVECTNNINIEYLTKCVWLLLSWGFVQLNGICSAFALMLKAHWALDTGGWSIMKFLA